jgi:hypothetical protein
MANQKLAHPELAAFEVHGMTRGGFILRGALATGAVYGTAAVAPFVSQALAQTSGGDVDILNFALTLEYLEADFYNVKGKAVGLSGLAKTYAHQFGADESEHVAAIASTIKKLGGTPAKEPKFAFPASSEASFLKLASVLENTGVSAYNGAAPMIQSKDVLAAAGSIVQIEARHAAAINALVGKSPTPDGGFDKTLTQKQVLAAAGPFIKM